LRVDNHRYYTFQRKLDTGDTAQDYIIVKDKKISMIWAVEASDAMVEHSDYGSFSATFTQGTAGGSTTTTSGSLDGNVDSTLTISPSLTLGWKFNPDDTIEFLVQWKSKSWIGIGLGKTVHNPTM
jgi:hypothetical protein